MTTKTKRKPEHMKALGAFQKWYAYAKGDPESYGIGFVKTFFSGWRHGAQAERNRITGLINETLISDAKKTDLLTAIVSLPTWTGRERPAYHEPLFLEESP